jgi:threonine dehydrogenase-like Zn-dependent dehydrogenase
LEDSFQLYITKHEQERRADVMHALMRFGTAFGGYKMMENYPEPECGPEDIIVKIRAAAICGADMKHW